MAGAAFFDKKEINNAPRPLKEKEAKTGGKE